MTRSPVLSGPQPLSRQQQILMILVTAFLVVILLVSAYLALNGGQAADSARVLLVLVFAAALLLSVFLFLLMRTSIRRDNAEFTRAYQSLEAQVLEQKSSEETLRAQNQYFGALNDTTLALVSRLNLTELLSDILHRAGELVGTQNGYVFLLDPQTNEMVMRVGVGSYEDFIGTKAQPGVALAGKVWQTGESVAVDDYRNWSGRLADPSRNMLRAVVGIPLRQAVHEGTDNVDHVIGVIGLAHLEADKRFGPAEMDVLNRFASLASIAIYNSQLYEAAQRELSQRKIAEGKLVFERDLLQALMDNIPDLIFFKDRESRFVRSNAAHLRNLGASHMDEVFGKTDLDYHVDAPAHQFMEDEKAILETGVSILNKVESNPAKDGTPRYFSTSKVPWRNQDGEIVGTLGVAHEITDRVIAEQKLEAQIAERQQTEQFLDSVVDNLPTMLFVKEANDLRFVRWNKAAEQISKYPGQLMLGKNDADIVPPDEAAFFAAKDRETLSGGEIVDIPEEPLQDADGNIHWLHTRKIPLMGPDGKPAFLLGISEDITERKKAEDELRTALERANFQNALISAQTDLSPDGILVVGGDDHILLHNRRFLEMWNISEAAMGSGSVEPIRQAVRDQLRDPEGWFRRTGEIYMKQGTSSHDEIEFKDNRIFERYSTPFSGPDGTYLGRVWFFHDITQSRQNEQDIRRVIQGTRVIFWRANVKKLDDATQQANGYEWSTKVSNPDAAAQYLPFDTLEGEAYEDAMYRSTLREDQIKMDQVSSAALLHEADGYNQEYRVIDANGKLHWLFEDARITPLTDKEYIVAGVKTDITERKLAEEQIQKQNAYLNALQETSVGLMQRLDVNSLLQDIVARAGALVGTENGYVFLLDPNGEEMELRVGVGTYQEFVGRRTKPGVGLAGQVWETNAPVVVDDYRTFGGRLADPSRDILRAVAGVPLGSGERVIGVIGLAYLDESRKFGEAEIQVLQRFAQLATISLDNALLYETAQLELSERARAESALEAQLRETELVNRVTGHAVTLDIDRALVEICRDLAEYYDVQQAGIALLSEDKQTLTVVADYSPPGATGVVGYVIPVQGNPSTEIVMATRQPAAFADAQTDPRLATIHDLMVTRGTASILIAPLFVRDDIIGTLGIDSFERREFTDTDIALVQRVALAISTALENARLYRSAQQEIADRIHAEQEMRKRNQELEVISRVSAVMTTDIDMTTALETLARELVQTFRARNCGIALLNSTKTELTVVADALAEEHEEHAVGIVIPLEGNLSSQYVVDNKRSLVIPDAQTDPMTEPIHERMRQRNTKCLAIIPLLSAGEVIGTIGLDTTDPTHMFSEEEIRLAETMANQMANAIEKQRLFDQTKERARREQLTREIGADMTRSLDMETILQTMARELSQALGASHAVVRMGTHEKVNNGGNGHT